MVPKIIENKIHNALNKLRDKDLFLLKADVNERSISHKLAQYLEETKDEFSELDIDCEYNRHGEIIKMVDVPKDAVSGNDFESKNIFPDIIIHERNNDNNNLLVIEIKKSSNRTNREFDIIKIQALSKPPYNYQFGLFIEINVDGRKYSLKWYENGVFSHETLI